MKKKENVACKTVFERFLLIVTAAICILGGFMLSAYGIFVCTTVASLPEDAEIMQNLPSYVPGVLYIISYIVCLMLFFMALIGFCGTIDKFYFVLGYKKPMGTLGLVCGLALGPFWLITAAGDHLSVSFDETMIALSVNFSSAIDTNIMHVVLGAGCLLAISGQILLIKFTQWHYRRKGIELKAKDGEKEEENPS